MSKGLTWLHISDIHFHPDTEWRDSTAREALLTYLAEEVFGRDNSLRPDLIFCTGDIAFGETRTSPLADQYQQAANFFDSLLAVCGRDGAPLSKDRLFVVPGNHDVNRATINSDAQATLTAWAGQAREHIQTINQRFNDCPIEFKDTIKRLDEYAQFVRTYLPHQEDSTGRHRYAHIVDVNGLKVGVAGFNSAWSCAGPEDDRTLWLAADWQFNAASSEIKDADIRIGLIHHPSDWLNVVDQDVATRRVASDFQFWLHGHVHNAWVVPSQSHITIAAGAVGAEADNEFGINLVNIDLNKSNGVVHLHAYSPRNHGWTIAPVARHAPSGQWSFDLPVSLRKAPAITTDAAVTDTPTLPRRTPGLFGRDALIKDVSAKIQHQPILIVYGLRGNGKSALIEALGQAAPLSGKEPIRYAVTPYTTPDELFRQFATLLGETAEIPKCPTGSVREIAAEVQRRYPNPRPAWAWIEHAHRLLNSQGFLHPEIGNLILGLQSSLGMKWHWVLEFRERPAPILLGESAVRVEVPGLDKASLAECLAHGAPAGRETDWSYRGDRLKAMYQWLGVGHGNQAHPLATQLLIEVARGRNETPWEALNRHRGDFRQEIEEKLLGDLYTNVLSPLEQRMIQALALYRSGIPHDHADALEQNLNSQGAWDWLDRRCLLSANAEHSLYYLHSFIASWLRTRMGYEGYGEDPEANLAETTDGRASKHVRDLHSAIAACWLEQLGGRRRVTNLNISRALEAFHHLVAAGDIDRVRHIAVELLAGNLEWAIQRIKTHSNNLFRSKSSITLQRKALEYWVILDPSDHSAQRFLGECWAKEEGRGSPKALRCFEEACRLRRDFPPYWANLGRTLLAQGREGASDFLKHLEALEQDHPEAIDDHVRSIQSDCLELIGQPDEAADLRMQRINAGSRDPVFYNDEAKARLDAGNIPGALEILDLAEKNGCADDFMAAVRSTALERSGQPGEAADLRMQRINAGSRDPVFYSDEAKARLDAGDITGALKILDLAEKNGCTDDFTAAVRSTALERSGQLSEAADLRMQRINAGSRHPVFYNDEAKARLDAGDIPGAVEILDLAEKNGCTDEVTVLIRAKISRRQRTD